MSSQTIHQKTIDSIKSEIEHDNPFYKYTEWSQVKYRKHDEFGRYKCGCMIYGGLIRGFCDTHLKRLYQIEKEQNQ